MDQYISKFVLLIEGLFISIRIFHIPRSFFQISNRSNVDISISVRFWNFPNFPFFKFHQSSIDIFSFPFLFRSIELIIFIIDISILKFFSFFSKYYHTSSINIHRFVSLILRRYPNIDHISIYISIRALECKICNGGTYVRFYRAWSIASKISCRER